MPGDRLPYIFENHMERLKGLMQIPKGKPIFVVIADDNEHAVIGMRTVLGHWNNLGLVTVIQAKGMPEIHDNTDIILLDDEMAKMTGADMTEWKLDHEFVGIIAATSFVDAERRQTYPYHFGDKVGVATSIDAAIRFIKFMNRLIEEIERDRMN